MKLLLKLYKTMVRMKIDKKDFLNILKKVSMAAEQKSALPILSNIYISTAEGSTYLTATNLEVEIEYKYPFQIIEDETEFLVDAKILSRMYVSIQRSSS